MRVNGASRSLDMDRLVRPRVSWGDNRGILIGSEHPHHRRALCLSDTGRTEYVQWEQLKALDSIPWPTTMKDMTSNETEAQPTPQALTGEDSVHGLVGHAAPEWTYSSYRATLYRNGKRFALVTPDARIALTEDDANTLLAALNGPTRSRPPIPAGSECGHN